MMCSFGRGRNEPASHTGQELIAHELTHVVQQTEVGRREKPGPRDQTEPRRVSVTNKQSEDCVQRMFGMEFEMQIPFCQKGPSGSLQEVTQGKKAKVQHATRRFRNEGDKTSGESGFKKEHGGLKVRSIAELVTNPIDENRLDDEGEVAEYFSPLVRTGERLAAIADSGEAGAAVPLKELPGFELTGQDYVFSPQHAGCKMINTAYVQATFGVNFRGMSGLVEELAQHHLDLGGMVAAQVGELYRESVIREADVFIRLLKPESFLSVDSRVDDLVDSRDYDYASVAGYLTYIATLINAGKNEVVSKDNAKNAVRLLNKAEIHAPQLGKAEVRQALRDLVLAHTKTNESTLLWREEAKSAIGVQKTVKDILDQMIPLKGDPSLEEGLLGEDWHKREADEGQGQPLHRDAILEARRVYGAVGVGLRLAPAQWVPALTQYWRLLKEANRS
jgi:Domain of unknown function (DUF4157)